MGSLSPSSTSRELLLILRKLQSIGYCLDLPESDLRPRKHRSFFNRILSLFYDEIQHKKETRPVPAMLGDGKAINLFELFFVVRERGGYESVTVKKDWASVSAAVGLDSDVGPSVKLLFFKYLGAFERWMEIILAKKENPKTLKAEKLKEEEGKSPVAGSKKNQFLTPVREGGRESKLDNDGKGDDVVIVEPEVAKRQSGSSKKRKRDALGLMLDWVLKVAKNPKDETIGKVLPPFDGGKEKGNNGELYSLVLSARKAMFLKIIRKTEEDTPKMQKGPKMHPSIYEDNNIDSATLASEGRRYSSRQHATNSLGVETGTSKKKLRNSISSSELDDSDVLSQLDDFMDRLPKPESSVKGKKEKHKKKVADEDREAKVPPSIDKSCSASYTSDDLKWLGTPIWPPEGQTSSLFKQDSIGKGRKDCFKCERPGSIECVRFHVAEKRVQLKRELGSAFNSWRFDHMGEEISLSWTEEEAEKFKTVVSLNRHSEQLWDELRLAFPLKGRKKLVSYYYNVFVLARRSYQNRMTPEDIDSDDEEAEFGFLSVPFGQEAIKVRPPKSNFCVQNKQCVVIDDD
ncbi:uncharacterized protein A4U43_C04F18690 [Asparagus officinalis]|uniref:ARID domain-containing protein n=1 Tax=Asparagus officinalis TaxID=4686 RepID=A0A5P1F1X8_ASPOF|nr:AT-rich interactive domain-containing protein 2 [Asparagus officinalis]ONK72368.1 uncharacterized protein A4U43_C04F18690 [Asparagus officinalis]